MTNKEKLEKLLLDNNGIISASLVKNAGIKNEYLRQLVKEGLIEKIERGVYTSPDEFEDSMYALQQSKPRIIYSHETSLYLHDLTDRDPLNYSVTVPSGYNAKRLIDKGINVYFIKKELYSLGLEEKKTIFGNTVFTYDKERTICDIIRNRNKMDIAIVTDALKRYVKQTDRNLNLLMEYAEKFGVTKILAKYMEVLL